MQCYQVLKYSLGGYSSKQTGSSLYCSEVSPAHLWSNAVTRGTWNNNMTALVNTLTRFTCQEDSGRAALRGRDDSSFPCFVLFAENSTIWGACSWRERERESSLCLLSCDLNFQACSVWSAVQASWEDKLFNDCLITPYKCMHATWQIYLRPLITVKWGK